MAPSVLPAPRRVAAGGRDLLLREAGVGRPLLCVHGNAASSRWFTELLHAPPAGWRVLAPDLPGFGGSDPLSGPTTMRAFADALADLLDALGVERAALLGHSLGGRVAETLAAARPERASALVLVAAPPPGPFVTPEERYPLLEAMARDRERMAAGLAALLAGRPPGYFDELVEDAVAAAPGAITASARALARPDPASRSRSDLPVLVVHGEADPLVPAGGARALAAAWPGAGLELLPAVGHAPPIEAPERFRALLSEFLEEVP